VSKMKIGAHYLGGGKCEFVVWAPLPNKVELEIIFPDEKVIQMKKDKMGYWHILAEKISPWTLYNFRLDNSISRPDPASNFQPRGVHGPSQVVDHDCFGWTDKQWSGIPLEKMIIYELHVGTFTTAGTFEAIVPRLKELVELGVNSIEIMPVAQFPGGRNWGYDGVDLFAVQDSYGGPEKMKKLVNSCHEHGIAVILDVVYNHFGPEGDYWRDFGPYFTEKYKIPWGKAINFDDAYSDDVRNFFIENAIYWFRHYHLDALRLDATHAIHDMSAKPFLGELAERVEEFSQEKKREFYLISENDLNDVKVVTPKENGGYGLDAQWCEDFHHSLHALLTGENSGYYADFDGVEDIARSLMEGYVYSWKYSRYRKKHHGSSSRDIPGQKFVVFSQNHDQVGNRMLGERLASLVSFEASKLAAAVVIVSPYVPLLFMGEEYCEKTPFLFFTSHLDQDLIKGVREGRREEFKAFQWAGEPLDPQDLATYARSKLDWGKRKKGKHKVLLEFYKNLILMRKAIPALSNLNKINMEVSVVKDAKLILLRRWKDKSQILSAMNFNKESSALHIDLPKGSWRKMVDSSDEKWKGPGTSAPEIIRDGERLNIGPLSFVLYSVGGRYG